jgi:hypothetical protein
MNTTQLIDLLVRFLVPIVVVAALLYVVSLLDFFDVRIRKVASAIVVLVFVVWLLLSLRDMIPTRGHTHRWTNLVNQTA